eukprot:1318508-Rhodomonas_salina.2
MCAAWAAVSCHGQGCPCTYVMLPSPAPILEHQRRPDGVVWNASTNQVVFLEFTQAMDNTLNFPLALCMKSQQYAAAEEAIM